MTFLAAQGIVSNFLKLCYIYSSLHLLTQSHACVCVRTHKHNIQLALCLPSHPHVSQKAELSKTEKSHRCSGVPGWMVDTPGICTHTHTSTQSAEVSGYLTVDLEGDGRAFTVRREEAMVRGKDKDEGKKMTEKQEVKG